MRRLACRLLTTLVASTVAVFVPTTSADADSGVCTGQGVANVWPPMVAPTTVTRLPTPVGTTTVTVQPPRTSAFTFAVVLGTCTDPAKAFTATGQVTGWCGHSSGVGVTSSGRWFAWVEAGGVVLFTGHVTGFAQVLADPTVGANDCVSNSVVFPGSPPGASRFIVTYAFGSSPCTFFDLTTTVWVPMPWLWQEPTVGPLKVSVQSGPPMAYSTRACL